MQITQKSKEIIDACRFCWMCRHICPVGNATGQERNTARARALSLSMVERDGLDFSEDIIDNVYECMLCGACTKECVTGFDPVKATKDVRLYAALEGKLPEYISKILDNLDKPGHNPYGIAEVDEGLKSKIAELGNSDTVLFLGTDAIYKTPKAAVNAITLLQKLGVDFTVMANAPDSGYSLNFAVGAAEETRQTALLCAKTLDFKTIICYDAYDASMFLREYKEWGIEMKGRVTTFTAFLADVLEKAALKKNNKTYAFQDPYALARDLEETEPARKILEKCGTVNEMLLHGKDTVAAGSLIMAEYMPDVMLNVARRRWDNAISSGAEALVCAQPAEYALLKAAKPDNMELLTIEEVVLSCL